MLAAKKANFATYGFIGARSTACCSKLAGGGVCEDSPFQFVTPRQYDVLYSDTMMMKKALLVLALAATSVTASAFIPSSSVKSVVSSNAVKNGPRLPFAK